MKKLLLLSFPLLLNPVNKILCQEANETNNSISIAPLSFIDQTISVSYSRKINNIFDLTINPRIRIQENNNLRNSYGSFLDPVEDPFWYYNRTAMRVGLMMHKRNIFIEPIIQFDYGFFKNKNLLIENAEGEAHDLYIRLNRRYLSYGFIGLLGFIKESESLRFKYYTGFGAHIKSYSERQLEETGFDGPIPFTPFDKNYNKFKVTFHAGFEIGLKF